MKKCQLNTLHMNGRDNYRQDHIGVLSSYLQNSFTVYNLRSLKWDIKTPQRCKVNPTSYCRVPFVEWNRKSEFLLRVSDQNGRNATSGTDSKKWSENMDLELWWLSAKSFGVTYKGKGWFLNKNHLGLGEEKNWHTRHIVGVGETTQWLRLLPALVDVWGSVLSLHLWCLTTRCSSSSKRSRIIFWRLWVLPSLSTHPSPQAHTSVNSFKNERSTVEQFSSLNVGFNLCSCWEYFETHFSHLEIVRLKVTGATQSHCCSPRSTIKAQWPEAERENEVLIEEEIRCCAISPLDSIQCC